MIPSATKDEVKNRAIARGVDVVDGVGESSLDCSLGLED
jgi:hypothetical protein